MTGSGTTRAFVGVSGFGYPSWRGGFYPEGAKPNEFLALYAERLPSVELNATGRRFPTVDQLARWAAATPPEFRFSMKLTSAVVLRPAAAPRFSDAARSLGARLGPVLVQLPALERHDSELSSALFEALAPDLTYAIELKDDAWEPERVRDEAGDLVASVVNEPLPDDAFAYYRFREPPYNDKDLALLATRLRAKLRQGVDVFGYFKHEDEPTGPRYAEKLLARLARP